MGRELYDLSSECDRKVMPNTETKAVEGLAERHENLKCTRSAFTFCPYCCSILTVKSLNVALT